MWWLSAYPVAGPAPRAEQLRAEARSAAPAQAQALESEAQRLDARHAQGNSFAGRIGRAVQPVFAPLGYDWQLTVGVLTSFMAAGSVRVDHDRAAGGATPTSSRSG